MLAYLESHAFGLDPNNIVVMETKENFSFGFQQTLVYLNKGPRKSYFQLFYISAFCSLTDKPTDKIFTE